MKLLTLGFLRMESWCLTVIPISCSYWMYIVNLNCCLSCLKLWIKLLCSTLRKRREHASPPHTHTQFKQICKNHGLSQVRQIAQNGNDSSWGHFKKQNKILSRSFCAWYWGMYSYMWVYHSSLNSANTVSENYGDPGENKNGLIFFLFLSW